MRPLPDPAATGTDQTLPSGRRGARLVIDSFFQRLCLCGQIRIQTDVAVSLRLERSG